MKYYMFLFLLPFCLLFSQDKNIVIKGRVLDEETKEPAVGANIVVLDTNLGAAADIDGKFELSMPADTNVIRVSMVGYDQQCLLISEASSRELVVELIPGEVEIACGGMLTTPSVDSNEIKGGTDALEDLQNDTYNLIQTSEVSELQKYYSRNYPFTFITNKKAKKAYRVAYNNVVQDYLKNKYGEHISETLYKYCWKNN